MYLCCVYVYKKSVEKAGREGGGKGEKDRWSSTRLCAATLYLNPILINLYSCSLPSLRSSTELTHGCPQVPFVSVCSFSPAAICPLHPAPLRAECGSNSAQQCPGGCRPPPQGAVPPSQRCAPSGGSVGCGHSHGEASRGDRAWPGGGKVRGARAGGGGARAGKWRSSAGRRGGDAEAVRARRAWAGVDCGLVRACARMCECGARTRVWAWGCGTASCGLPGGSVFSPRRHSSWLGCVGGTRTPPPPRFPRS